ncbi:S-adenosyl-L-methionine-dependent methyltransferase [Podospora fimiseda]|uniref:S-adenosyl-L-methionine-dependent methyltransferase n=1 Tax=Podospora fimiseda TaxID=252190 RepID=A0AAN7H3V3_9PEZI|nr:S-adenosyl-L-methionine-dependent methyltransferase [Podospora fimiseda]
MTQDPSTTKQTPQGHNNNYDLPSQTNRLISTFSTHKDNLQTYHKQWDIIWKDNYTPWDRGVPSVALSDFLSSSPPTPVSSSKALVPGCGRGYDVLLLSSFGFDVIGLDYSGTSLSKAKELETRVITGGDDVPEIYKLKPGVEKRGEIQWVQGDFFVEEVLKESGAERFDLIYDYTFFVALPPTARSKWGKRMKELLNPKGGRLVCLEWPLRRDVKEGGPPWGVTEQSYKEALEGLKKLKRYKPERTHDAGYDEKGNVIDFLSVWGY